MFETGLHQSINFFHPFPSGETIANSGGGSSQLSLKLCFPCSDFVSHHNLENIEPMLEELLMQCLSTGVNRFKNWIIV